MSQPIFHEDIAAAELLKKTLGELANSYEKLLGEVKATMKSLQEDTQKATKVTSEHVQAVKQEKDRYTELIEAQKKILKAQQENEKAVIKATEARKKQVIAIREANTIAQQEARTIDEMRKKVSALNLLWKNSEIGTKVQKELAAQLSKTTAELKRQEQAVGIHSRNVGNYSSALKGMGMNILGAAGLLGGLGLAFSKVTGFITGSIDAVKEKEINERKLSTALGYTSNSLLAQASALQKVTAFSDDSTVESMAFLAMMGLEEGQIKKIIPLIQDLAAAKGMDLASAADLVAKSIGSSTNAMKRYGIDIEGAAGSSERMESAVAALTEKFGGQAAAIGALDVSAVDKWNNAWGDFLEVAGARILPILSSIAVAMTNILEKTQEGGLRTVNSFSDFVANIWEGVKITVMGAPAYIKTTTDNALANLKKTTDDAAKLTAEAARNEELRKQRAADAAKLAAEKAADAAKKAEEERIAANERQIASNKKVGEEAKKEYENWLNVEKPKIEDAAYKLSKDLGTASYQEVYDYELNLITTSAAFRVLLEGKTAEEVLRIWKEASDKAAKAAQGFTVSGLPTPEAESGEQDDFMGTMSANMVINPDDIIQPDKWKESFDTINNYAQLFGGVISDILRMISESNQRNLEREMEVVANRYESETTLLDEQLRNRTISETQYNARKAAAEQKKQADEAKLKKEAAKKQRDIALTQAIINTALSVTSALTTGPFIVGLLLALVAAAMGAVEIATISSAQFAKGGHMKLGTEGTTLKGKRHSAGGVNLGEIGTAEQGEYLGIINRQATNKYQDTLPLIFDSLNKQNFENVFAHPKLMINVDSPYTKKMYKEMIREKKAEPVTIITDGMIITQMGNHTVRTHL